MAPLRHALVLGGYGLLVLAGAEVAARVDDRVRFGVPLLSAPSENADLLEVVDGRVRGRPNGHFGAVRRDAGGFRRAAANPVREGCEVVVVLGASESLGRTDIAEDEWPARLAARQPASGCRVIRNAAIAGSPVSRLVAIWDGWARAVRPAVVIVYPTPSLYLSDGRPSIADRERPFHRPPGSSPRVIQRLRDVVELPGYIQRRRVAGWLEAAAAGKPADWRWTSAPPAAVADFEAHLDSLMVHIRADGARPVLVTHPTRFGPRLRPGDEVWLDAWRVFAPRASREAMLDMERQSNAALHRVAARHGVSVVEADSALSGRRDLFLDQIHLARTGNALLADLVDGALTER